MEILKIIKEGIRKINPYFETEKVNPYNHKEIIQKKIDMMNFLENSKNNLKDMERVHHLEEFDSKKRQALIKYQEYIKNKHQIHC